MANPLAIKPYYAAVATLGGTKISVMAAIIAHYAAISNAQVPPGLCASELHLTAEKGNAGNDVLVGDENITTSLFGNQLTVTVVDRRQSYGPFVTQKIPLDDIYLLAGSGSPKVLIEVIV